MKETVLTSTILILAILIVRRLFQNKVSRKLIYGIWLLVALRLLVPVQFGNFDFSILKPVAPVERVLTEISDNPVAGPSQEEVYSQIVQNYIQQDTSAFVPEVQEQIQSAVDSGAQTPAEIYDSISKEYSAQSMLTPEAKTMAEAAVEAASAAPTVGDILTIVWLTGMVFMAVWFLVVNLKHNKQIREVATPLSSVRGPIPVMVSPLVDSPCLAGLFHPVIYLTPDCAADKAIRRHVLVHELTHYKNKDHIWAFVRCVCLCVYWFHPLVWVAALVSNRDCELACDEGALKRLGSAERINYGKTLLRVVSQAASPTALLHTATSMNESKKQLTERVNYIVKKPKVWIGAAVCTVLACAIATGCAFAGAASPVGVLQPTGPVEDRVELLGNKPGTSVVTKPAENAATEHAQAPATEPEETQAAEIVSIKDSFLPIGRAGNFFYVPNEIAEGYSDDVYILGGNLLIRNENELKLLDLKTGELAGHLRYKHNISEQVIADYVVVEDVVAEMIDIYDSNLNYVKSYPYPNVDIVIQNWFMGTDLKSFYYFDSICAEVDNHIVNICCLDLETKETRVIATDLLEIDFQTDASSGGFLFDYYDMKTGADRTAFLDLTNGTVEMAPVEGRHEWGSEKVGDVWLLDRGCLQDSYIYRTYELYVGDRHTTMVEEEMALLKEQKQLMVRNGTRLTLYDLEGNVISLCDTDGTNTDFGWGTMCIWSESLNGYFLRSCSAEDNFRLYFWDVSATVNGPLGLA